MQAVMNFFMRLAFFLILVSKLSNGYSTNHLQPQKLGFYPPTCNRIECPNYDLIQSGKDYEIRRYNSSMWMSTAPIDDINLYSATRTGFLRYLWFFFFFLVMNSFRLCCIFGYVSYCAIPIKACLFSVQDSLRKQLRVTYISIN